MRGKPRKGVLRHSNQQISELFKSSEILSSLSKSLFDKLNAPPFGGALFYGVMVSPGVQGWGSVEPVVDKLKESICPPVRR